MYKGFQLNRSGQNYYYATKGRRNLACINNEYRLSDFDQDTLMCSSYSNLIQAIDWYYKDRKYVEETYSETFVRELCYEVMNLGMKLRQDQLAYYDGRSGNEVLKEFLDEKLK